MLIRLHRETEQDKISNELLNKLIPMETLNSYYLFGYAGALVNLKTTIEKCNIENRIFLLELINKMSEQNEEVNSYYVRLNQKEL